MSLLLRFSEKERMARSVGDPPNGVLGVAEPEGVATLIVDGGYEPTGVPGVHPEEREDGMRPRCVPITATAAIEACEDDIAVEFVVWSVRACFAVAVQNAVGSRVYVADQLQSHVDLLREVEDAVRKRYGDA